MTPAAEKTAVLALFFFTLLFFKLQPYAHTQTVAHSAKEYLFTLYFFICNQSLGIVHEAGHGICYFLHCPQFITALNGTLFQLLFPAFIVFYAKRRGHDIAAMAGLLLLGFSLKYTAWYMSTAHLQRIVPASRSFLGQDGYHDFNYLFSRLHVLSYDGAISTVTGVIATLLMVYALLKMFWIAFFKPHGDADGRAPGKLRAGPGRRKRGGAQSEARPTRPSRDQ
jgi:hypothetical protein